jgi:hypothetical protein
VDIVILVHDVPFGFHVPSSIFSIAGVDTITKALVHVCDVKMLQIGNDKLICRSSNGQQGGSADLCPVEMEKQICFQGCLQI